MLNTPTPMLGMASEIARGDAVGRDVEAGGILEAVGGDVLAEVRSGN